MKRETFHFLYIDTNSDTREEIAKEFSKDDKLLSFHSSYIVKVTTCGDFRLAMTMLLISNYGNFRKQYNEEFGENIRAIDSIIFEIDLNSNSRYNWRSFLRDCDLIGFSTLNLNKGLIAVAPPTAFSSSFLETLMGYGVRKKILSPFTQEQFEDAIKVYLNRVHGSTYLGVEQTISKSPGTKKETVARVVRFVGENQEDRTLSVDVLEYDPTTFITRSINNPWTDSYNQEDDPEDTLPQKQSQTEAV